MQVGQGLIHSRVVLRDNGLALLAVGLLDGLLDLGDGFVFGQDARDGEEAALHDGVDAHAHAGLLGYIVSVDHKELQLLADDRFLDFLGQGVPDLVLAEGGVQQEGGALRRGIQHVVFLEEAGLVAGDEVGLLDEVGGTDRAGPEAEMADRDGAGLLGVVDEVALAVEAGLLGDDLDGVLIGAHGAVGTQPVEHRALDIIGLDIEVGIHRDAGVGDVVDDADHEVILAFGTGHVFEHGLDAGRGEFLAGKPVTTGDDLGIQGSETLIPGFAQGGDDVEVERIAGRAGFLHAFQDGEFFRGLGQGIDEVLDGEGTIQANLEHADLLALGLSPFHILVGHIGAGAHDDHDVLGVRGAEILEELVLAARQLGKRIHFLLHDGGNGVEVWVAGFAGLEEYVRVLGGAAEHGLVGTQGALAVGGHQLVRHHGAEIVVGQDLDLGDLVAGPEPIEVVHEGDAAAQGGTLGNQGEVMGLLDAIGTQHGEAGLAAAHDVRMVAEDGEGVGSDGAGRDVQHERGQLASDQVHVRNEEQEPLGRRERSGQGTGLQRAMHGTRGTSLRLHLDDERNRVPDVFLALRGPFVRPLAHVGGRGDRVDRYDFIGAVGDGGCRLVAIKSDHASFSHGHASLSSGYKRKPAGKKL